MSLQPARMEFLVVDAETAFPAHVYFGAGKADKAGKAVVERAGQAADYREEGGQGVSPLFQQLAEDHMRLPRICLLVLASSVLLVYGGLRAPAQDKESHATLVVPPLRDYNREALVRHSRRSPVVEVVQRVRGAVVNIHSERTVHSPVPVDFFSLAPSQSRVNGMGTGILIDPRGYIVTNHHVIEDVSAIRIRLSDGTTGVAQVIARSPEMDLALLKIEANHALQIMPLGTAEDLMVGETVIAIGNAYGYEHTVSAGVVSAVKRDVSLNKEMSYKSLIQTDASINPGNSGGPLLNVNGELVGVNVAIRAGAQGIGFAIPVDTMIRVVGDMLHSRRRGTTSEGLSFRDQLDQGSDGLVRKVVVTTNDVGGPAGLAGVKKGDEIVQMGDVRVACSFDVERALLDRRPGEVIPITVRRNGHEERLKLNLASADRSHASPTDLVRSKLGLQFRPVDADVVARVNAQLHGGLEVTAVDSESIAAKHGIRRGDILVGLHQWETLTVDNVAFVLGHPDLASFNPLSFYIVRNGQVRRGWLANVN
jgi:serine protease Do